MPETIRAAAVQMEAEVGNVDANLEMADALVRAAAAEGATWIVLPEFFASGVANRPELRDAAPAADGAPTALLRELARELGVHLSGSTLVRDADDHVRNAFLLAGPDGALLGRHDKDLPTMWENALYVGGVDHNPSDTPPGAALRARIGDRGRAAVWGYVLLSPDFERLPASNLHVKLDEVAYIDVLSRGLKVMDSTAITLCMDNDLPIVVFDLMGDRLIARILHGETIGTLVS